MGPAIYYLILAVLAILVILLAIKTSLLKDSSTLSLAESPYSLSRSQLAFWTVLILGSFVYVWLNDAGDVPELNNVNLILLGITVGTTATGRLIDDSQKTNPNLSQNFPTEGFLNDILSDKQGVSVHRLQNVLWTIVAGIIYIHYVVSMRSLPDDTVMTDNLLILMGVSTTAYLGIKTTENK